MSCHELCCVNFWNESIKISEFFSFKSKIRSLKCWTYIDAPDNVTEVTVWRRSFSLCHVKTSDVSGNVCGQSADSCDFLNEYFGGFSEGLAAAAEKTDFSGILFLVSNQQFELSY